MKFTLSWLKEHLETDAALEAIVETLTRIGLEVEGVENPAEKLAPFTIAQVLTVDAGAGERPHAEGGGDPRRRKPRHDVLGPRTGAGR